jgi:hypothetical protein
VCQSQSLVVLHSPAAHATRVCTLYNSRASRHLDTKAVASTLTSTLTTRTLDTYSVTASTPALDTTLDTILDTRHLQRMESPSTHPRHSLDTGLDTLDTSTARAQVFTLILIG